MAVPFLNSITLNKNEVQDFKVFNIGTGNPTLSSGGDIGYFWTDTATSVLKWWDGSAVRTVLDTSSSISGSQISGNITGGSGFVANALTAGSYLTSGGTFDGSVARTFAVDATDANTASKIVARDASGNFSAGTITASLSGNATTATNVAGGAAGELLYQSGLATTAKLGVGTDGYILTYDGTNTKPKWSASIPAGSVSGLAASATTDTTNAANITSGLLPLARLALATGQFYVGDASNNPAATAKSSISLTGFGALTADLDIAGFNIINSGNVTSGSSGSTLATKGYVDSVAQGLDIKASCLVASTADINLSAPGSGLIDGIDPATFTSGTTRILVKDQSLSQQNGIYIWNGTGSAMTRSLDANTWDELVGAFTFIETGTANADSGWVCNVNAGGTLGTTAVTWTKFSQAGAYDAGSGMVLSAGKFYFATATPYTPGQIPYASTSSAIGFKSVTGTGDVVLATSPTLVTPALGTPTSGNLSSCTGLSLTTGVTGTLPVGNGGTGATTFTAGQVLFGNGTSAINTSANLFWDNGNSRLGIGTATPAYALDVVGTGQFDTGYLYARYDNTKQFLRLGSDGTNDIYLSGSVPLGISGAAGINFLTNSGGLGVRMTLSAAGNLGLGVTPSEWISGGNFNLPNSAGIVSKGLYLNTGTNYYYDGAFKYVGAGRATLFNQGDGAFVWQNAGNNTGPAGAALSFSPLMTLDASGNLGVGVTTVGERIHASGNIKAAASAGNFPRFISEVGAKSWATGYRSGTTSFEIWEDSTTRLAIANGGQVRVGINGTASVPAIALAANPDTGLYWPTDADTLALAVGGSDAVYIDSSRNVGIGTNPGYKLDIRDNSTGLLARLSSTSTGGCSMQFVSTSTNGRTYRIGSNYVSGAGEFSIYDDTAGLERLRIKSTGQLNLTGLASAPTGAVGDLYYNSTSNTLQYHNNSAFQQLSRKYTVALNDGSVTVVGNAYTITHNMGSQDITVSVRRTTDNAVVLTDVSMPSTSTATITFAAAITASQYVVTVIG